MIHERLERFQSAGVLVRKATAKARRAVRSPLVKLPRGERRHVTPPTAAHVLAVHRRLADGYRLPLVVLESTGMRVGELEVLAWDDVDEARARWRTGHKTESSLRWVAPPTVVFETVLALKPSSSVVELNPGEAPVVFDGFRRHDSAPRSRERAALPACPRSRRTACGTDASRGCTPTASHGHALANSSGTPTSSRPPARTRTSSPTKPSSTTRDSLPDGDNCEQERIKGFGWDSLDPRSASGYGLAGTRHDGSVATRLESGRNGPDFPRHPVV